MNVLDENVPGHQRRALLRRRVRVRQIGVDLGRPGIRDEQIAVLLHSIHRPTLFTLDDDFNDTRWCHPSYCIVYLDIDDSQTAEYVRRVLRHPGLNTQAKRMGAVVHASPYGLRVWRRHADEEALDWA